MDEPFGHSQGVPYGSGSLPGRRAVLAVSAALLEVCQYCGRHFCAEHCTEVKGHEAVCARKPCRAKWDDVAVHLEYRSRVTQRNHVGLCGVEDCGPHPGYQCSLCKGHFCGRHLSERLYPFRQGYITVERPVSLCDRCWQRRKVWAAQ